MCIYIYIYIYIHIIHTIYTLYLYIHMYIYIYTHIIHIIDIYYSFWRVRVLDADAQRRDRGALSKGIYYSRVQYSLV